MKKFEGVTDEQLALLYAKGNNRAFDELLDRTKSKLFTYIMFVVRDHDIADDIFQETFVKVIMKLQSGHYADTGKFQFWVSRIAHNVMMDWYRQQQNHHFVEPNKENDLQNLRGASIMDNCRESELVNEQVLHDVTRLMNTLPATQREVVYMRFFQQLSFKEIAETTGVSINTSLGRMRYAILNMRRMARESSLSLQLDA